MLIASLLPVQLMTAYNRLVRPREGLNPFEGDDDEEEYHDANGEGIYQEITEQ